MYARLQTPESNAELVPATMVDTFVFTSHVLLALVYVKRVHSSKPCLGMSIYCGLFSKFCKKNG